MFGSISIPANNSPYFSIDGVVNLLNDTVEHGPTIQIQDQRLVLVLERLNPHQVMLQ